MPAEEGDYAPTGAGSPVGGREGLARDFNPGRARPPGGVADRSLQVFTAFYFFTSKSLEPAGLPSAVISTLYFPTGQPLGLEMWNSLVAGPVGAMLRSSSLTTLPASPKVHLAWSFTDGAAPSVATEA